MFCMNCGKELTESMKFCPACGTPTGQVKKPEAPAAEPMAPVTASAAPEVPSEIRRIFQEAPYSERFPLFAVSERLYALPLTTDPETAELALTSVAAMLKRLKNKYGIETVNFRGDPNRSIPAFAAQLHLALEARDREAARQPGYAAPAACMQKTEKLNWVPAVMKQFMDSLQKEERYLVVSCALYTFRISRTGSVAEFSAAAQYIYSLLEGLQNRQGIRGINLRPEVLNADVLCYVEMVDRGAKLKAELAARQASKQAEVHFRSVEEADAWLRTQDRIKILRMNVRTHTGGGFGVHALEIDDVRFNLEWLDTPTNFRYGFCSEKSTKLYVKGSLDAFARDWMERNPRLRYVCGLKRTASGALVGGLGYLKFNNEHYFVLYTAPVE